MTTESINSKFKDSVEFELVTALKLEPLFVEFKFVLGTIFVFEFEFEFEFVSGI
jgi:hypothetical protein